MHRYSYYKTAACTLNVSIGDPQANKEEILKLYKIQLGREFCPWDDSYPGMKEIEFDLGRESLFVMIDGQEINADAVRKEDRIIAAISIDDDPQVERLDCWSHKLAPGAEISRLAVHPDFQNQKIARQMLVFGMEELARRGYKSVHFLVNKLNVRLCARMQYLDLIQWVNVACLGSRFCAMKKACKKI